MHLLLSFHSLDWFLLNGALTWLTRFICLVIQLEEGNNVENLQAQRCRARIDHLGSADVENITDWNNTKLKRILVDYMLRMSYFETASKLSESSNIMVSLSRH